MVGIADHGINISKEIDTMNENVKKDSEKKAVFTCPDCREQFSGWKYFYNRRGEGFRCPHCDWVACFDVTDDGKLMNPTKEELTINGPSWVHVWHLLLLQ